MKYEKRLEAGERWDVPAFGQYLGYVSGAGEIELSIDGELHYLGVNEVYESFNGFKSVSIRNTSNLAGDFVIKAGMGKLYMAGDGQVIDVLGIRSTVSTEVLNADDVSAPIVAALAQQLTASIANTGDISNPIVNALAQQLTASIANAGDISNPIVNALAQQLTASIANAGDISAPIVTALAQTLTANIANTGDISAPIVTALAQQLTAQITGIVSTLEKPAASIATSNKTFTAGESFTIPANTNRRDITIFAAETNTDTVTVAGIPLSSGQYVELKNYVGSIGTTAAAADSITIVEVIK